MWRTPLFLSRNRRGALCHLICQLSQQLAHVTAAWLRHFHVKTEVLEGGFEAWKAVMLPCENAGARRPRAHGLSNSRQAKGRSYRLPLADPVLCRSGCGFCMSCVQRSLRSRAFQCCAFDIDNALFCHRSELCAFDVRIMGFSLPTPSLLLATLVCGADTSRLDLCPEEAPGLLAA
jgi:hypothetical protein